jgi:hypothetical protein
MKSLPSAHELQPFLESLQNNGVSDPEFLTGILCQVNGISVYSRNATERGFLLSIIKGGNPKTQTDVLLLTQMAAIHDAVMTSARNHATANDPELVERFANVTNKLARTFTAQVEALQRCRSVNEKNITVQNVSIRDSAQAILGNVSHNSRDDGPANGTKSSLAISDQSGIAMPVIKPRQKPAKTPVRGRHANDEPSQA